RWAVQERGGAGCARIREWIWPGRSRECRVRETMAAGLIRPRPEGGTPMTASATCRRPGEQTDTVRLPASPVLLAGAALMQRLLTSGQRKRSRGRGEQAEARMRRGAQRKYTGGPNNAEAAPGEAEEEASASPG